MASKEKTIAALRKQLEDPTLSEKDFEKILDRIDSVKRLS